MLYVGINSLMNYEKPIQLSDTTLNLSFILMSRYSILIKCNQYSKEYEHFK